MSNPRINSLSLRDTRAALVLALLNVDAVTAEFKPELLDNIVALRDRERRLVATSKRIAAIERAR